MRSRTQIIYIWLLLVPFLALIEIGFGILELVANKGLYWVAVSSIQGQAHVSSPAQFL